MSMFKGLGNLGNLFKQAQEFGGRFEEIQQRLRGKRVTGHSGGGMVEVELNGLGEVLRMRLDPLLVEKQDAEMIEDLVPAAINQGLQKAKQLHAETIKSLTDGLNIPIPGLSEAIQKLTGGGAEPPDDSPARPEYL